MSDSKVIVFSCDAMVYEDILYLLETSPRFKELYAKGSGVKRVKTIYPSVTYPCHTTMSTGAYPNKHGVTNNSEFHPGQLKNVPWNWFADVVKCPDIFAAAKAAGKTTAAVFWPVTGNNQNIDYLVDEYWPQGPEDSKKDCYLRSGTTEELYRVAVEPYMEGLKIRSHPDTDDFLINCCCDIIKHYQPDLLMVHTGDVDAYRHKSGLFTPMVTKGVEDTERWFYQLMDAAKEAGIYEKTNFFLISDHGQMEIVRSVKPNVLFAENGLMDIDENGNMTDWKAYCHSTGMSAQIRLKDPSDREVWQKTYDLLKMMEYEGVYGISKVYTAEEIDELEHLNGEFSFVVETDGYSSFSEDWKRPIVAPLDITDYRFGRATHGHLPDKGPQPVFFAVGPDIKEGVYLERRPTVDEAPTYAKILGAEMPWADGVAIDEILVNGDQ